MHRDSYERALDAAYRSLHDSSINKLHTGRDDNGFRIIWALSDQGPNWFIWFSEAEHDYKESE
jgi:hypothetical protein